MRHIPTIICLIVASFTTGCQSANKENRGPSAPASTPQTSAGSKPAAYINGTVVSCDQLFAVMAEAHGGEALSELILDRLLAERLDAEGIQLTENDLQRERDRLRETLSTDADEGQRLINQMRAELGLGEKRYAALLRRNAGMRALVQAGLTINEPAIRQAYELRYGKRYRVRLITAEAVNTLSRARQRAIDGASFTSLAIKLSTDSSAAQGGLLSPISPADPSYPQAVREVLPRLSADDRASRISPVIALADGYALLYLEEVVTPQAPAFEAVRDELTQAVRGDLERVRMRQLARSLIESANAVVLDPALERSWREHYQSISKPQ